MLFHQIRNLKALLGFHTKRKIIVFESDDWGSIRMPSTQVYSRFKKLGFDMDSGISSRFNRFDSLATADDLIRLFEVLTSVKDSNGNYFVMTPMSLVANPDFVKIRETGFREYHYEPFTLTLSRYPGCERSFQLWMEGIAAGIFMPQFHGREHLNISRWLDGLQVGDKDTHIAFENNFWGYPKRTGSYKYDQSYQAAFDFENPSELYLQEKIIIDGLKLFKRIFGYDATCFTPPNGPLSSNIESSFSDRGIKILQTARIIYHEPIGYGRTRNRFRYLGKRNQSGQIYFIRNCFFEPSEDMDFNWVDKCIHDIDIAFRFNQPAVISSHRVNYIGALNPQNRDKGLLQLRGLLNKIKRKFPDVEYLTTSQLGEMILKHGYQEV